MSTTIQSGFEVYSELDGQTVEFFTSSLGDAYRIGKKATQLKNEPMVIGRCKEELYVDQDGTAYETVEYLSGDILHIINPKIKE